jgi:hypothetical protein
MDGDGDGPRPVLPSEGMDDGVGDRLRDRELQVLQGGIGNALAAGELNGRVANAADFIGDRGDAS